MNLIKLKGLVVRTCDVKESDRLVTLYTDEMGLITAMAKGARSLKSRHMVTTLQFCYSSFVLYKKGDLFWIKESELIESFFDIRNKIEGLALASYISEVVCDVATAESDIDLLRLSLNSLYAISSGKYNVSLVKASFEIRCAAILGLMPDLSRCTVCGESSGSFYLDVMGGTVKCYECYHKEERLRAIPDQPHESRIIRILTEGAKAALEYSIFAPLEKLFSFKVEGEDLRLFCGAAEDYLINQLERSFNSLAFYKEVSR